MAQRRSNSGCLAVAVVALILLIVAVIVVMGFYWLKASRETGHARAVEVHETARLHAASSLDANRAEGMVILDQEDIQRVPRLLEGQPLTREDYVMHVLDSQATNLMREEFARKANGAAVQWLLQTEDMRNRDGTIEGSFLLPYEVHYGNSTRASMVGISCTFTPEDRDALLGVRRGDWVVVRGTLSVDKRGKNPKITEARLGNESEVTGPAGR